ncbi:MAG: hypothetical protein ACI9UK_002002 [Candidatus Krumholzibacteriia bacterium]|jgi:hypothetical protein
MVASWVQWGNGPVCGGLKTGFCADELVGRKLFRLLKQAAYHLGERATGA